MEVHGAGTANYFVEIFKRWDCKETVCHTGGDTSASLMYMQVLAIII